MQRGKPFAFSVAAALGLACGVAFVAHAQSSDGLRPRMGNHGDGHAENHDWYQQLKQPQTGYACCHGTTDNIEGDCRPTRAYLTDDGTWRALVDGKWLRVPPKVVLQQLAPDGRSHICANRSGTIYCFLGGSPKS